MTLSRAFAKSPSLGDLSEKVFSDFRATLARRGISLTKNSLPAAFSSLIAGPALIANLIQAFGAPFPAGRALNVLVMPDPLMKIDGGAWLALTSKFLGCDEIKFHWLDCLPGNQPQKTAHAYAEAYHLAGFDYIDRKRACETIDLVVWIHPALEMIEVEASQAQQEAWREVRKLAESGVPVYAASYSVTDAECQSILLSQDGFALEATEGTEFSLNRHALSVKGVGYHGGWGLVLSRLVRRSARFEPNDVALVRCAAALTGLRAVNPDGWYLGCELGKDHSDDETTIALLGEFAFGVSTGRIYRIGGEADAPILECIGHSWDALRAVPATSKERIIWASRLYLLHFSELEISAGEREAAIRMLAKAGLDGCHEAKISLAFALSDSKKESERALAERCFNEAAELFPHTLFMKAVEASENENREMAINLMRKASDAGYPAALHDYGRYLVEQGSTPYEGLYLINRAADLRDRDACITQATIRFENGDFEGAFRLLRGNWQQGDSESLALAKTYFQLLKSQRPNLESQQGLIAELAAIEQKSTHG